MALLPRIPERPADRPETFAEYQRRRDLIAMHRRFADDLAAFLKSDPPPAFEPFAYFQQLGAARPRLLYTPRSVPFEVFTYSWTSGAAGPTRVETAPSRSEAVATWFVDDDVDFGDLFFIDEHDVSWGGL